MKILMLDKNYLIDRRIVLMAQSLASVGHEITLFCQNMPNDGKQDQEPGLTIVPFPTLRPLAPEDEAKLNPFERWRRRRIKYLTKTITDTPGGARSARFELFFHSPDYALQAIPWARAPLWAKSGAFLFFRTWKLVFGPHRKSATPVIGPLAQWRAARIRELENQLETAPRKSQRLTRMELFFHSPDYALFGVNHMAAPGWAKAPIRAWFHSWKFAFGPHAPRQARTPTEKRKAKGRSFGMPQYVSEPDEWDQMVTEAGIAFRPDVLHANDYVTLRAAYLIQRKLGCPIVYDAHELYSYQPGFDALTRKTMLAEENALVRFVSAIIVINAQQAEIMARDFNFEKFVVCTNATKPPAGFDVRKRGTRLRDAIELKPGERVMLFQGGVNIPRRVDFILKGLAASKRTNVHMAFLTFGFEVEFFKQMSKELGIANRVHFLPLVPWNEVLYWASSADAGFMPYQASDMNTTISSPNKMYEFIAAGTPMIGSSELVNVNRVVGGEGLGVLKPFRKVEDYTAAIDEMFDDSLGGPERFWPALQAKSESYGWDAEVRGVLGLYEELKKTLAKSAVAAEVALNPGFVMSERPGPVRGETI